MTAQAGRNPGSASRVDSTIRRTPCGHTLPGDAPVSKYVRSTRFVRSGAVGALMVCAALLLGTQPASAQLAGGGGFSGGTGGTGAGAAGGAAGGRGGAGTGAGAGAAAGVVVDAEGVVRPVFVKDRTGQLDRKRREELAAKWLPGDLNVYSPMRKVSLKRIEELCEEYVKGNKHVPTEVQYLAGLQRIDYVFADPGGHDIVIAGPAEGFVIDAAGRAIGNSTSRPPLRLDDLFVALQALNREGGTIGCSIDPTEANLANFKQYMAQSSGAISPSQARAKFEKLGEVLGMQTVRVFGVPADSHFAELLVEADIHMKRLSIGVDRSPVKGFRSHLSMVGAGENTMQRWWFTPLYDAFTKSDDGLAFAFSGQRVQLMSQEELVSDSGTRSNAPFTHVSGQKFAKQFTDKFPEMANAEPMFAELQSLFDLAVLGALLKKERLPDRVGWAMSLFLDPDRASIVKRNVPKQVESVSNYKTIGKSLFVAQVSGGVTIDPRMVVQSAEFRGDSSRTVESAKAKAMETDRPEKHPWWWD